jgi:hypothetical protein
VEMALQDAMRVCNPNIKTPFQSLEDAVSRCPFSPPYTPSCPFLFPCFRMWYCINLFIFLLRSLRPWSVVIYYLEMVGLLRRYC